MSEMYGRIHTQAKERCQCCVCRKEIMLNESVQRNQVNGRYKHAECQPKNGKVLKTLTEDEQRIANRDSVSSVRHGRVIRGTRSL